MDTLRCGADPHVAAKFHVLREEISHHLSRFDLKLGERANLARRGKPATQRSASPSSSSSPPKQHGSPVLLPPLAADPEIPSAATAADAASAVSPGSRPERARQTKGAMKRPEAAGKNGGPRRTDETESVGEAEN